MKYLIFLFPSLCFAGDWTTVDTVWQSAYTLALIGDCAQSRDAANYYPYKYMETNPVLGEHPSKGRIDNVCLATAIGHLGISYLLPAPWRRVWQVGTTVVEVGVVIHQHSIGLKFQF